MVKKSTVFLLPLLLLLQFGCGSPSSSNPGEEDSLHFNYALFTQNLRPLGNGRHYQLWFKYTGDDRWSSITPIKVRRLYDGDSSILGGNYTGDPFKDQLQEILVSVEPDSQQITQPTAKLLWGTVTQDSNHATARLTGTNGIGEYSSEIKGNILFTTKSSDTTKAKYEFYFANKNGNDLAASLKGLPVPSPEWTYAVWVIDSNFFPMHRFMMGTFTQAEGFDSQSSQDSYPFPGGKTNVALNFPGKQVIVTIEPTFDLEKLPTVGPSPFNVLQTQLMSFISYDQEKELTNVTATGIPTADFTVTVQRY